jgi:AcrR family transcriptional regulator
VTESAGGRGSRLRADARRNLDQIVAAARESFAERGIEVPMEEVARRAGVGVGTLYRRFPDREALIEAVVIDTLHRMADLVPADRLSEPGEALWRFLDNCVEYRLGLLQSALQPRIAEAIQRNSELRAARDAFVEVVEDMVQRAKDSGILRADAGAGDVLLILGLVLRPLPAVSGEAAAAFRRRVLAIAMEGLRTPIHRRLPGDAISMADLDPQRWADRPG